MARWIRRLVFASLVLAVLYALLYLVLAHRSGTLVERELASIRLRGEPVRIEEMAPEGIPDDENAAVSILQAMDVLRAATEEEKEARESLYDDPFGADDGTAALVRRWVEGNSAALEHLEEAGRRPSCRFDVVRGSPPDVGGVEVIPLLGCGEVVVARALLRARAGETEAAFRDLALALHLARRTGTEPVLILFMVRIVMEKDALDAMEHLLARHGPSAATGEALRRELDRAAHQVAHRRAILGERCFGIATYSSDPSDTELSMRDIGLLARLVPGPSRRLDQARYLRLMARALELSARPWYDVAGDWDGLIVEARDEPWFGGSGGFAVGGTAEFWATGVAHRARLAMAAFSLDMGPTPIDPFTGRPFAVSTGEDGLSVIRSPGPDPESTADDIAWKWRAR